MGHICVHGTNTIDSTDDSAPNTQIPHPGTPGRLDENPAIAYGTAFQRFLTWLYNVRLDWPYDDILMLPDDISAAFHQLFYHPRMMPVFASVFESFLCIPAGTIFGSRSSPGYYMLPGELRAWLAGALPFGDAQVCIMDNTSLPPQPPLVDRRQFTQATRDAFNPGATTLTAHGVSALYPVFVDDTGNANVHHHMSSTVTASVLSAYLLFGFPGGDTWAHRPPCINEKKWNYTMSHRTTFLGFNIDTRTMQVTWPLDKQTRLRDRINEIIQAATQDNGFVSCRLIAQALGLLRNGCAVVPLGATLSLQIQHAFNDCIKDHM